MKKGEIKFSQWKEIMMNEIKLCLEFQKENRLLRQLVEWADECGVTFDWLGDIADKYSDELSKLSYIDGLIFLTERYLEEENE